MEGRGCIQHSVLKCFKVFSSVTSSLVGLGRSAEQVHPAGSFGILFKDRLDPFYHGSMRAMTSGKCRNHPMDLGGMQKIETIKYVWEVVRFLRENRTTSCFLFQGSAVLKQCIVSILYMFREEASLKRLSVGLERLRQLTSSQWSFGPLLIVQEIFSHRLTEVHDQKWGYHQSILGTPRKTRTSTPDNGMWKFSWKVNIANQLKFSWMVFYELFHGLPDDPQFYILFHVAPWQLLKKYVHIVMTEFMGPLTTHNSIPYFMWSPDNCSRNIFTYFHDLLFVGPLMVPWWSDLFVGPLQMPLRLQWAPPWPVDTCGTWGSGW